MAALAPSQRRLKEKLRCCGNILAIITPLVKQSDLHQKLVQLKYRDELFWYK